MRDRHQDVRVLSLRTSHLTLEIRAAVAPGDRHAHQL
jgi:hypothetical protein